MEKRYKIWFYMPEQLLAKLIGRRLDALFRPYFCDVVELQTAVMTELYRLCPWLHDTFEELCCVGEAVPTDDWIFKTRLHGKSLEKNLNGWAKHSKHRATLDKIMVFRKPISRGEAKYMAEHPDPVEPNTFINYVLAVHGGIEPTTKVGYTGTGSRAENRIREIRREHKNKGTGLNPANAWASVFEAPDETAARFVESRAHQLCFQKGYKLAPGAGKETFENLDTNTAHAILLQAYTEWVRADTQQKLSFGQTL